nr:MAG TPA_asm: Protein of unknown function (DUF2724) [Caudoviricetes sp.]DAM11649.1 MAG TPA: Protein of unknown function (DUF2724) [Caudoviricetes sp.]
MFHPHNRYFFAGGFSPTPSYGRGWIKSHQFI